MCKSKRLYTQEEQKTIREFKSVAGHECHYCHKQIEEKEVITVDHKIPYSRGGKTVKENLVIACEHCNTEKSDLTEVEYIDYLTTKENLIKNNDSLKMIRNMIISNESIITKYAESLKLISTKQKEKSEIEKCITNMKFNASEGYMLCKDMKNVMIELNNIRKESARLFKLNKMAMSQKDKLQNTYEELTTDIIKELRMEMNIGQLANKSA